MSKKDRIKTGAKIDPYNLEIDNKPFGRKGGKAIKLTLFGRVVKKYIFRHNEPGSYYEAKRKAINEAQTRNELKGKK